METKDVITLSISLLALIVATLSLLLTMARDRRDKALRSVKVLFEKPPWSTEQKRQWPFTITNPSEWPVMLKGVYIPQNQNYRLDPLHAHGGLLDLTASSRSNFQAKSIRVEPGTTQGGTVDFFFTDIPSEREKPIPVTFVFEEFGLTERQFRRTIRRTIRL